MATAFTNADYTSMLAKLQFSLAHGTVLRNADLVKLVQMLQDASANIPGLTAIAANTGVDGTPAIGVGSVIG